MNLPCNTSIPDRTPGHITFGAPEGEGEEVRMGVEWAGRVGVGERGWGWRVQKIQGRKVCGPGKESGI